MKRAITIIFLALLIPSICVADPVITLFLRAYPATPQPKNRKKQKKNKKNGTNSGQQIANASGIFATNAGNLNVSNQEGRIEFPLKQAKPEFSLLVTAKITPILYARNTIHHWELEEGTPTAFYKIEKKYDQDSKSYYWLTSEQKLPDDKVVPLDSIIFFANPEDIYIPEGIVVSDENKNLTLPDFYVKETIDKAEHAFYVLGIKNFLHPINLEYKKNEAKHATQIVD